MLGGKREGRTFGKGTLGVVGAAVVIFLIWRILPGLEEKQMTREEEKIVIGYCADNLVIERWQRDQEIFVAKAMEEGVEVIVHNANENNAMQISQIKSLIDKKVDVLVVIPYDKEGLAEVITEAHEAGIKVIAYDRLINNAPVDAYLTFDNIKVGQIQGEKVLELAPKGNYVLINGSPDDNNSAMFRQGTLEVLEPYVESGDVTIVADVWADNWREEYAYETVSALIDEGVEIDAVIGANDRLAEEAILALAEAGLAGEVIVAGHDADISACQRIVEGTQHVTVYKPIRELAVRAVEVAVAMAKDEPLVFYESIDNGYMDVNYVRLDVLGVTGATLEETVIADGFHLKEDIYREGR